MTAEVGLRAAPGPDAWPRRLVCVSVNAAIDKIAAVDRLVPGEIHRPEVLSVVPGGKALNVARAAAALGLPVRAIAVLGGHAGDWMEAALRERGISTRTVRAGGETRTCLSVLDRATGTLTEFYEPGLTLDAAGWAGVEAALRAELVDDPAGSPRRPRREPAPGGAGRRLRPAGRDRGRGRGPGGRRRRPGCAGSSAGGAAVAREGERTGGIGRGRSPRVRFSRGGR